VKKRISLVVALCVSFASGMLVEGSAHKLKLVASGGSQEVDAAFRDGVYQAELDVQKGRRPRLLVGRWSTERDRALYIAGYQKGYGEFSGTSTGEVNEISVAELAATGYRDGMLDGARHRSTSQPFQAEQTANYRDAGMAYLDAEADSEFYKRYYREGYFNGYQHGYYTQGKLEGIEGNQ
jgi:hypothetical protein